jgi:hypothetical protein
VQQGSATVRGAVVEPRDLPLQFVPVVGMLQFPRQMALHLGALEDFLAAIDPVNQFSDREHGKHFDAAIDADRLRFALRRISDFPVPRNADVRFSDLAAERDAQPSHSLPFANALCANRVKKSHPSAVRVKADCSAADSRQDRLRNIDSY